MATPTEALIKIAESFEKLAKSIEEDTRYQGEVKTASVDSPDYGSIGNQPYYDSDPLTEFCMKR